MPRSQAPSPLPQSFPQSTTDTYTDNNLQQLGSGDDNVLSPFTASKAAELMKMFHRTGPDSQNTPFQQFEATCKAVQLEPSTVASKYSIRAKLEGEMRPLLDDALYAVTWLSDHKDELALAKKKLADHEQGISLMDIKEKILVLGRLAKAFVVENERNVAARILGPLVLKIQSVESTE